MLDPSTTFSLTGPLVLAAWVGLILSLFVRPVRPVAWPAAQILVPVILAAAYVLLIWQGRSAFESGGFGSIEEIRALFANDAVLVAGWFHYLAFDLFVGAWIAREGIERRIPGLLLLPCLALAFLFGPAGFLLFLTLRLAFRERLVPETA
jgi:hypothetical protein